MASETEELLACPWCSADQGEGLCIDYGATKQMRCETCGAEGPEARATQDAIRAWNTRALTTRPSPAPDREAVARIYIASKAKHRPLWRQLRNAGAPIVARWIDTPDVYIGTTLGDGDLNYSKLWVECVEDVSAADVVVVYVEGAEVLKGALVEVGVAMGLGKPVVVCGHHEALANNGTWRAHPSVRYTEQPIEQLVAKADAILALFQQGPRT